MNDHELSDASVLLVRHARPVVDPGHHRRLWPLSPEGVTAATALGRRLQPILAGRIVAASSERKAIETARLVAPHSVPVVSALLDEIDHSWYDDADQRDSHALRALAGEHVPGWETAGHAAERFDNVITGLDGPACIVSHGMVTAAWIRRVSPGEDAAAWWRALTMPDAWLVHRAPLTIERI